MRILAVFVVVCVMCLDMAGVAFGLPRGRHYELVSPSYKGGYGVARLEAVAVEGGGEGDRVAFASEGTFAGAPADSFVSNNYFAQRTTGVGWSTTPLMVPVSALPAAGGVTEFSPGLDSVLFERAWPGMNSGEAEEVSPEPEFVYHRLDLPDTAPNAPLLGPNFEVFGFPLKRLDGKRLVFPTAEGVNPSMCHLLVRSAFGSNELEPLLSDAIGTQADLYELTRGGPDCGGAPSVLRLVGVVGSSENPESISAHCPTVLGGNRFGEGNQFNAISDDGSEILFTANAVRLNQECDGNPAENSAANPATLFVRLNGERTVELSRPIAADCQSGAPCATAAQQRAEFVGADEVGARAYFTTKQPLVTGDVDTRKDLYLAKLGCPLAQLECSVAEREVASLVQVSHDSNSGEAADVQGVVDVAPDGSRVYFVARGVLSGEASSLGEGAQEKPVAGADNLYVYDAESEEVRFIADLCSGPSLSGETGDSRCAADLEKESVQGLHPRNDTQLWREAPEAQTAGHDGRFLLFSTFARLLTNDRDTTRDVYRYDAENGRLDRVSVGEGEYDANGNNNSFDAKLPQLVQNGQLQQNHEMAYRAISEDGSRVVFETAEPLSPAVQNHFVNAYEWHEEPGSSHAEVSLVSNGADQEPVGEEPGQGVKGIMITPSGRDIFFITVQGLLPQDTDGARDVYDARLGEGFPATPGGKRECGGDACQGPLNTPAPLLLAGSEVQAPGENVSSGTAPKNVAKGKAKHRRHRRKHRPKRGHAKRKASKGRSRR